MLFGVKKQYQRIGVPLVAINHLRKAMAGYPDWQYIEFGWNLEDNDAINKLEMEGGAEINKRYRIFRKTL